MQKEFLRYRIIVEGELHEGKIVYVAYAPSLGISDFGKTTDLAVSNIEKAISLYIETLAELNVQSFAYA